MSPSPGLPSAHPAPFLTPTLVAGGAAPAPAVAAPFVPAPRAPLSGARPAAPALPVSPARPAGPAGLAPPRHVPAAPAPSAPAPFGSAPFGSAPFGGGFPGMHHGPAPAGVPPHLAAVLAQPPRPSTVTAAGVLWIVTGALHLVWAAFLAAMAVDVPVLVPVLSALVGVALVVPAPAMLRGSGPARIVLTVAGVLAGLAVVPLVLVVPALVVQWVPPAGAWFADAARRRALARS